MSVRGVDDDDVGLRIQQGLGAGETRFADPGRGGGPEPAFLVLAGVRELLRLFHVLHGDQADAAELAVDDDQLFDPVLVQKPLGLPPPRRLPRR